MKKEDIAHLAKLSRIEIGEDEATALASDITSILGYVSEIEDIAGERAPEKSVGVHFNIMREDENPHEPGIYTDALLNAAPKREGRYIKVKKILGDKS